MEGPGTPEPYLTGLQPSGGYGYPIGLDPPPGAGKAAQDRPPVPVKGTMGITLTLLAA